MKEIVAFDDIVNAARTIDGVARRTPVMTSARLDEIVGASVFLKCEHLQHGGAFKIRGAYNRISAAASNGATGIAAISSGNHALAVAIASKRVGMPAVVLMPEDAPPNKVAATVERGAEVIRFDRYADDRDLLVRELAEGRGYELVHPYDDPVVMAGQGTVAAELLDQVPDLDVVLVPVGGGGLIAGCATAAKHLRPSIRVIGAEPAAVNDLHRSMDAGRLMRIPVAFTIADGQQAPVGSLTFAVARKLVDEIVDVDDQQIMDAMRLLVDELDQRVEPSGASALAGLIAHASHLGVTGARVGVVVSGGNVSPERFAELTANIT